MKSFSLSNAVSLVNSNANKALTLVPSSNGARTRLSAELWTELESPESVEVLQVGDQIVILAAREGGNALKLGKGRYLYDTSIAKGIAELAGINLGESKSVSVGRYEMCTSEEDESVKLAVVSF
ncbi:MAG: hypothetical protein K5695_08020 [Oscillospiraceae bacterium]|nr:hypothetical protein [Oscillospiraceae bacterium]